MIVHSDANTFDRTLPFQNVFFLFLQTIHQKQQVFQNLFPFFLCFPLLLERVKKATCWVSWTHLFRISGQKQPSSYRISTAATTQTCAIRAALSSTPASVCWEETVSMTVWNVANNGHMFSLRMALVVSVQIVHEPAGVLYHHIYRLIRNNVNRKWYIQGTGSSLGFWILKHSHSCIIFQTIDSSSRIR